MPLDLPRIQALCFDVDGTLRDTDDQYAHTFARLLRPFRRLLPGQSEQALARTLVTRLERPANLFYGLPDRLGLDAALATLAETLHQKGWLPTRTHRLLLIPGVREALEALHGRFPLAIVSARGHRATLAFLDHFSLTPYFQAIATAQTAPYTKPHPDPILWAARQLGVDPRACLMIGDTTIDMRAGKAAGAQTLGVLCGFGTEKDLLAHGADHTLPSIADLPGLFSGAGPW